MLVFSNPAPTLLGYDDRSSLWEEKRERVFLPCLKLKAGCVLEGMSSIKSEKSLRDRHKSSWVAKQLRMVHSRRGALCMHEDSRGWGQPTFEPRSPKSDALFPFSLAKFLAPFEHQTIWRYREVEMLGFIRC